MRTATISLPGRGKKQVEVLMEFPKYGTFVGPIVDIWKYVPKTPTPEGYDTLVGQLVTEHGIVVHDYGCLDKRGRPGTYGWFMRVICSGTFPAACTTIQEYGKCADLNDVQLGRLLCFNIPPFHDRYTATLADGSTIGWEV